MVNHAEASRLNIERMKQIYQQLSCYRGLGEDAGPRSSNTPPGERRKSYNLVCLCLQGFWLRFPPTPTATGTAAPRRVSRWRRPTTPALRPVSSGTHTHTHSRHAPPPLPTGSDQEASCLAGYQMPVHAQGSWQSPVMMYMQEPQPGMAAHQQGESNLPNPRHLSVSLPPLGVCNSVNISELQVMQAPVPGSCVTLRTRSRFQVHRLRKVRTSTLLGD